jgi:tetratricopeptide (TPR) repeat protein
LLAFGLECEVAHRGLSIRGSVEAPVTRRLVAILVADVVGFSRHMEQDDAGTLARLREWRPSEALTLVNQAIAMDPQGNPAQLPMACEAQLLLGQYGQAIASCEKAKGSSGESWMVDLFLAAAYGQLGDARKAAAAKDAVLRSIPGYTIAVHKARGYSASPEYARLAEEHLYAGLRKAGFAEK